MAEDGTRWALNPFPPNPFWDSDTKNLLGLVIPHGQWGFLPHPHSWCHQDNLTGEVSRFPGGSRVHTPGAESEGCWLLHSSSPAPLQLRGLMAWGQGQEHPGGDSPLAAAHFIPSISILPFPIFLKAPDISCSAGTRCENTNSFHVP